MKDLTKYWLLAFLFGNISAQFLLLRPISDMIFYPLIFTGVLLLAINIGTIANKTFVKEFAFIFWYIAGLWLYQVLLGYDHINEKTWTYLPAKSVACMMIALSIKKSEWFYWDKLFKIISIAVVALICVGFFTGRSVYGRMTFGFMNANAIGALAAICLGIVFIRDCFPKYPRWIILCILFITILLTGSRSAFGLIILAFILKPGFKSKILFFTACGAILIFFVLPIFNVHFIALERFNETIEAGSVSQGRELERKATLLMIAKSPWTGNGIYAEQSEEAKKISELGSHNAYLDYVKWFGIPYGVIFICGILFFALKVIFRFVKSRDPVARSYMFVVIGILLVANVEAYTWGVNQMVTTIFFISFALLSKDAYDNRLKPVR